MAAIGKKYNKQLLSIILLIIFAFLAIPFSFFKNLNITCLFLLIVIIFLALRIKQGFSILLLAISFCTPYSANIEDSSAINQLTWWPTNIIREAIVLIFFYLFYCKRLKSAGIQYNQFILFFTLIILGFFYFLINQTSSEMIGWISNFVYFYLFFYIVYYDRFTIFNFLFALDIIFLITTVYAIMEYLFHISPYNKIYELYPVYNIDEIARAKGLLGHPLVLSLFVIVYQTTLLIRYILFKRLNLFELICLLISLILAIFTTSRTTIIITSFTFIYTFFAAKAYRNAKIMILFATISFTLYLGVASFFNYVIQNNIDRFNNSSSEHREAGYSSVLRYFYDNIWGSGYTDLTKKIYRGGYATNGLIEGFGTLDNFFLTQIGAYGFFSFLVFLFYFYYVHLAFKLRKYDIDTFKCILLIFIVWCMIGLSFDLEQYICSLLIFSGIYAVLLRRLIFKRKIKYLKFKKRKECCVL